MTAKPGIVIGRKGASVNVLKQHVGEADQRHGQESAVDVLEVERPEMDADLVAESIAEQLERRVSQKRAMRQA